jgi:hypothetical protein
MVLFGFTQCLYIFWQRIQLYYDKLEHLFVKGKILDAEKRKRFMAHFRPKIRKLCVVHTYVDMDELLATAIKVEKVLGEIEETPFEPLKDEGMKKLIQGRAQ